MLFVYRIKSSMGKIFKRAQGDLGKLRGPDGPSHCFLRGE